MEETYILALEILILGLAMNFMPLYGSFMILLIILTAVFFFKRRALLCIASILFFIRFVVAVDIGTHSQGEKLFLKVDAESSRIESINGKIPIRKSYFAGDIFQEGKIEIEGNFNKLETYETKDYFNVEVENIEEIPAGAVRRFLDKRVEDLTKNYSGDIEKFYRAIILGEKNGLSEETKEMFAYTGTSHLIVISGLHIGVIIAIIIFLCSRLPVNHDSRYFVGAAVLTLYTSGVGFTPSVLRAYIMGMCYLGGELLYEKPEGKKSLAVAFIISLFINPLTLKEISFQMSFMAVFAIMCIYPVAEKKISSIKVLPFIKKVILMGTLSLTIQLALTPIFLVNFRSIPVFSFFVNLIAIPLGIVFVQLSFVSLLLSLVGMGWFIMPAVNLSYLSLVNLIEVASKIPLLSISYYGIKYPGMLAAVYMSSFWIIFAKGKSKILAVLPCMIMFFWNSDPQVEELKYKGISYFGGKSGYILANRPVTERDIFFLRDRGVEDVEVIISPYRSDKKIKKLLKVREEIQLEEGRVINIEGKRFLNSGKGIERI